MLKSVAQVATDATSDEGGWSVGHLAALAETSMQAVRDAIDAGVLEVKSHVPMRVAAASSEQFITACRAAKLERVRVFAPDLLDAGYLRPYQIAELLRIDERTLLNSIQRGRLPAIGRGLWLFVSPGDVAKFSAGMRRAA